MAFLFSRPYVPPIPRSDLEYPTEDVSFIYLMTIDKVIIDSWMVSTLDDFIDKALETLERIQNCGGNHVIKGRVDLATDTFYVLIYSPPATTSDFYISKYLNGVETQIGSEAIDLAVNSKQGMMLSISGSAIKGLRDEDILIYPNKTNVSTVRISVTDTDIASGKFSKGYTYIRIDTTGVDRFIYHPFSAYLRPPSSPLPSPSTIIEYDIIGSGTREDPYRPDMPENITTVEPYGNVNTLAVTWGSIDYKGEPTMLCAIHSSSPKYLEKDRILKHIEYAKRKGHKVFKPPRTPQEAHELYKLIRRDRPKILITKNELAYQLIGASELEVDAVAGFYERELLNLNRIKNVPEWELRHTLDRWIERARKYKHEEAINILKRCKRK